jgi:acyl-CoA reductase-like NAD-dependent aldehyde dehydrogenase
MTVAVPRGTLKPPDTAAGPPTSRSAIDEAIADLQGAKRAWTAVSAAERAGLAAELSRRFLAVADRWTAACEKAERIDPKASGAGEEALVGPYFILRNLRLLRKSLDGIARTGRPPLPGKIWTRPLAIGSDQLVVRTFPQDLYDRLFYTGVTAEAWMEPGVTRESLPETMAVAYHQAERPGGVALVLGAGNVSSIGPMDALYKLFVEDKVVLYKPNPANAYLGPLVEEAFEPFIDRGFFRLVYGGAEVGSYLCNHPGVDEIHITGSDKTYEAIVWGGGLDGERRKREGRPLLAKPVSAELGNVSPVIVVPGPWSAGDIAYHAENLATMLTNNAGFNCNAARVIVTDAAWAEREPFLAAFRRVLARVPPRHAWYPGAAERFDTFLARHPEADTFGERAQGALPWGFAAGLDPAREDEICFTTESFCSFCGETALRAGSVPEFIGRAVDFANDRLWGTLNATLIVHPRSLADPEVARAVDSAVADLRYGTVAINHWAATGYGLVVTPWGAYPGHTAADIQSGTGWVHNTLMFSRVQKSVVRAPFRVLPKPVWFATHKTAGRLTPKLTRFEANPSPAKLPGIFALALRG